MTDRQECFIQRDYLHRQVLVRFTENFLESRRRAGCWQPSPVKYPIRWQGPGYEPLGFWTVILPERTPDFQRWTEAHALEVAVGLLVQEPPALIQMRERIRKSYLRRFPWLNESKIIKR